MKKKSNVLKKYIEAVIGCVILVVGVLMCISGSTFIKMLPIAFIIGIIGYFIFDKKLMTSFFSFLLAIVLLQIRVPSQIFSNIITAMQIGVSCLLGEVCSLYIKDLIHLFKLKNNKSRKKEKFKSVLICLVSLIIALEINSLTNGNYLSYAKAKKNLQNYFIEEYSSGSRFQIISSKYVYAANSRYVFYTQDTLNHNDVGKFIVYLNKNESIQDDYKEQILNKVSDDITEKISNIEKNEMDIKVLYDDMNVLTISFSKIVDNVDKNAVEIYAKQLAQYISEAKKIPEFNEIEQIKIVLESKNDSKENLASYIYMDGYNQMLNKAEEEPYQYIVKALNIEYFD